MNAETYNEDLMHEGILKWRSEQRDKPVKRERNFRTEAHRLRHERTRKAEDETAGFVRGVFEQVAREYKITPEQILTGGNARNFSRPRGVAYTILRRLTTLSYTSIGRIAKHKHPSTVSHGVSNIEALYQADPKFREVFDRLLKEWQK